MTDCQSLLCLFYLSGVALTLRQFSSDGTEVMPPLDQDPNYDFNFQDARRIGPRQINPVCLYYIIGVQYVGNTG